MFISFEKAGFSVFHFFAISKPFFNFGIQISGVLRGLSKSVQMCGPKFISFEKVRVFGFLFHQVISPPFLNFGPQISEVL